MAARAAPRARALAKRGARAAVDRALPRARRALRRRPSTRRALPAGPRPGLALRIVGRAFLPEGRASRICAAPRRSAPRSTSRSLGVRRARRRRIARAPRQPLRRRPRRRRSRRHRPALRALALRRAARGERADVRRRCATALEGEPTLVDETLDELTRELVARAPARPRRADRAVPRQRLRRVPDRARDQARRRRHAHRARRRLRQHRAARARASRACSTTSTTSRSTTASGRCSRCSSTLARHAARRCVRTFVRRGGAVVLETDATLHDVPHARRRHADLRRPAARSLPLAVRDAEPDAPPLVRRPLEQAHDRARLLLEEVHVLRRHRSTTSRATTGRAPTRSSIASRRSSTRPAQTGFHFVDEAAPPAGLRALAERLIERKRRDHLVGQHPLREDVHARALRAARALRLRRGQRRARGRVRSAARRS